METSIVFAFYKDNEFKGFRADTFNTISKTYAKPYYYSEDQVETVLKNVKSGLNHAGGSFIKELITSYGADQSVADHVNETESQLREWGEFEVRVLPITKEFQEEMYEMEEWKLKVWLNNVEPIESHKFKLLNNEN